MNNKGSKCYGTARNLAEAVMNHKIPGTSRADVEFVKMWLKDEVQRTDFSKFRSVRTMRTEDIIQEKEYVVLMNFTMRSVVDEDYPEDTFVRELARRRFNRLDRIKIIFFETKISPRLS